jgi:hypothetical protein
VTPPARFARILRNPSLYPGVAEALGPDFPWHTHAGSPRSSQALCLSAWAPLAKLDERHAVVDALLAEWLPGLAPPPAAGRRWSIRLEVSDPDVLGERGGRPSAIDVVLEAGDTVVCVESKFLRDALAVFRGCDQFPEACRGFYGPGSDRAGGTNAPCRLAMRDGRREARRYWDVAAGLLRPELLAPGPGVPGSCPLHRQSQLARTLLYAKALAEWRASPRRAPGGREFAALVIAPAATAGLLERQTAAFAGALLPEHAGRVAVAHYEGLVRLLQTCAGEEARAVGAFVAGLLPAAAAAPRTTTARELRRRAVAERRARGAAIGPAEDDAAAPRTMAP